MLKCFHSAAVEDYLARASAKVRAMRLFKQQLGHECVLLTAHHESEAVAVMTRSFAGTADASPEMALDWALGPGLRAKWDDPQRLRWFEFYMRWVFVGAIQKGLLIGVRDSKTAQLLAVCAVYPPGRALDAIDNSSLGALPKMAGLMCSIGQLPPDWVDSRTYPDVADRMDAFTKQMLAVYLQLRPKLGEHWYVSYMGVSPQAQGRGCTRTALELVGAIADADGLSCYIEANSDRNQAIYTKLGFSRTLIKEATPVKPRLQRDDNPSPRTSHMLRPPVGGA